MAVAQHGDEGASHALTYYAVVDQAGAEARLAVAEARDRAHPPAARPCRPYRPSDRRRSEIFRHRELGAAGRHPEQAASSRAPHRHAASAHRQARSTSPRRCRRTCSRASTCSASTRALRSDRRSARGVSAGPCRADLAPPGPRRRRHARRQPAPHRRGPARGFRGLRAAAADAGAVALGRRPVAAEAFTALVGPAGPIDELAEAYKAPSAGSGPIRPATSRSSRASARWCGRLAAPRRPSARHRDRQVAARRRPTSSSATAGRACSRRSRPPTTRPRSRIRA